MMAVFNLWRQHNTDKHWVTTHILIFGKQSQSNYTSLPTQSWWEKYTFWGLMGATGGVPGGLCVAKSVVKVRFAICMHSSRVLRKVVHVDFTILPVSRPIWEGNINIHVGCRLLTKSAKIICSQKIQDVYDNFILSINTYIATPN